MYKPPPRSYGFKSKEHHTMRSYMANLWLNCPPEKEATFFDSFMKDQNLHLTYATQLFTQVKAEKK